jgi:anti-sigma regulatory factor (Ser/Thr protein kinase)
VRVETTRVATPLRLQHAVAFCASDADLLGQALPIIEGGLGRGEPVAVALRPSTERALHRVVGKPAGLIVLDRPDSPDACSGQTLAAQWARELRVLTADAGPMTMVSEHNGRLDGVDGGFWTELDAAVNVALADVPVALTCLFPELPLHLEVIEGARRNHPLVVHDGVARHNPDHRCPRDVLAERPAPAPMLLGPPELRLRFSAWRLHDVRAAVEQVATAAGFGLSRVEDIVLAVNEVATNAVEHGRIEAELCVWLDADGLVCEVHDAGRLVDPLPGLRAPHPGESRGRGVWIARQLCDLLHVWSDGQGTHVRLRASA